MTPRSARLIACLGVLALSPMAIACTDAKPIDGQVSLQMESGQTITPAGTTIAAYELTDVIRTVDRNETAIQDCPTAEAFDLMLINGELDEAEASLNRCDTALMRPSSGSAVATTQTDGDGRFSIDTRGRPAVLFSRYRLGGGDRAPIVEWVVRAKPGDTVLLNQNNDIAPDSYWAVIASLE